MRKPSAALLERVSPALQAIRLEKINRRTAGFGLKPPQFSSQAFPARMMKQAGWGRTLGKGSGPKSLWHGASEWPKSHDDRPYRT
jgi:hypothetical protein